MPRKNGEPSCIVWAVSLFILVLAILANFRGGLSDSSDRGPTIFSTYPWTVPRLSSSQLAEYHANGFIVLRGAIPSQAVGALATFAEAKVRPAYWDYIGVYLIGCSYLPWLQFDLLRDLWWHGPFGAVAAQLLGAGGSGEARGVRLLNDHLYMLERGQSGFPLHNKIDKAYESDMHVKFWIPLDDVDPAITGGSLFVVSHAELAKHSPACWDAVRGRLSPSNATAQLEAGCLAYAESIKGAASFARGDILALAPGMLVASQPLLASEGAPGALAVRRSLVAGFVTDDLEQLSRALPHYKRNVVLQALYPLPDCYFPSAPAPCHPLVHPRRHPDETSARIRGDLYTEPSGLSKAIAWGFIPFVKQKNDFTRSK